ncbi:DUF805 domain-containing protein [Brevundimonas vesicularis]|nr:DUF805 domain-containing protein [Brevundimonas vesicularis]MDX2336361.1 DUF805 domain-containing protein [Brevundimonas vesicularis]
MSILLRPLLRYADFKGRASRREYFGFMIVQSLVAGLIMMVMIAAGRADDPGVVGVAVLGAFGLLGLMMLGLLIPNYAVLTRRLHDCGRSAWWLLLLAPNVLAIIMIMGALGGMVQHAAQGVDAAQAVPALLAGLGGAGVMILAGQICGVILFVLTLLPGEAGENTYGPDPRTGGGWEPKASTIDEARLETLFEEARRGMAENAAAPARPAPTPWDRPVYDPGIVPSRPFGKRT